MTIEQVIALLNEQAKIRVPSQRQFWIDAAKAVQELKDQKNCYCGQPVRSDFW